MNKTVIASAAALALAAATLFVLAKPDDRCAISAPGCWAIRLSPDRTHKERRSYRAGVIIFAPFEGACGAVNDCTGHEGDEDRFGP